MKYLVKITALVLALGFTFSACQKDYDSTPDVTKDPVANPLRGSFSCTMNGENFTAEVKTATLKDGMLMITGTQYGESRTAGTYVQVALVIPTYAGPSTYNVNNLASIAIVRSDANGWSANYASQSNDNYFVKVEGVYKGTFQAALVNNSDPNDKILIENGKFDITE